MKRYVSILFFFLFFVFSSCNQNTKVAIQQNKIIEITELIEKSLNENLDFETQEIFIDSARMLAKEVNVDTLELQSLATKTYLYSINKKDYAQKHINELKQLSQTKNNLSYLAYSYSLLGMHYYEKSHFDSAYFHLNKSNGYYKEINNNTHQVYNLILMTRMHLFSHDFIGAEELATQALELNKGVDLAYESELNNLLSHSYREVGAYDQSIYYLDKSLKQNEDGLAAESVIKHNIATIFIRKNQPDTAIVILKDLLSNKDIFNTNKNLEINILSNLGYALFLSEENLGIEEMILAEKIIDSLGYENEKSNNYLNISKYYLNKEFQKSLSYLQKAESIAAKYHKADNQLDALKLLIQISPPSISSDYAKQYLELNDSITNIRQSTKNQFAKIRYDYSKEQEQNLLLKNKNAADELTIQKQKNTTLILFSSILLLIIITVFSYIYLRDRHKRQRIIDSFKTENKIATRIHDELANDVFNTLSYSEQKDLSLSEHREKLLDHLENIYERTRNFSKENKSIDTNIPFSELLKNLLTEYQHPGIKIISQGLDQPYWTTIDNLTKMNLYRILQELLVNMKKHSRANLVVIKFEKINKNGVLHYSDNGIGIDLDEKIHKNGLQNVETRTKAIKGKLTFESKKGKGLKIRIAFPI